MRELWVQNELSIGAVICAAALQEGAFDSYWGVVLCSEGPR